MSVPGPLRHSYVRRATAHAHTIPNLKPEIWTKHCVTPSSISYVSYFISLSSLSLSLLEPDQSSLHAGAWLPRAAIEEEKFEGHMITYRLVTTSVYRLPVGQ